MLVASKHKVNQVGPPTDIATANADMVVRSSEPDEVQHFSCNALGTIAGILKPTTANAGAVLKSLGEDNNE